MNSVSLIGRLTANPAVHAGEKHASATFRLAVPKTGSDGADFIDIVTFDKLAGVCAQWLTKGQKVAVVGKLRLSEWTGRDGERRSKVQVSHPTKPEVSPGTPGWPTPSSSSASRPRPPGPTGASPSRTTSRATGPPSAGTARPADPGRRGGHPTTGWPPQPLFQKGVLP